MKRRTFIAGVGGVGASAFAIDQSEGGKECGTVVGHNEDKGGAKVPPSGWETLSEWDVPDGAGSVTLTTPFEASVSKDTVRFILRIVDTNTDEKYPDEDGTFTPFPAGNTIGTHITLHTPGEVAGHTLELQAQSLTSNTEEPVAVSVGWQATAPDC